MKFGMEIDHKHAYKFCIGNFFMLTLTNSSSPNITKVIKSKRTR